MIVACAAAVTGCGSSETTSQSTSTSSSATDSSTSDTGSSTTYTMDEVSQHADDSSCWVAIDGNVYDVTEWIGEHPGGPTRIENLCGTDGTAMFRGQHGTQSAPNDQLASFQIGTLSE
ncbi:MAG: cytochrome b5 domain-containing protein [Actinomycetales bacterium]